LHIATNERRPIGRPRVEARDNLAGVPGRIERLSYTLPEAKQATGLSENTLRRRAAEGRLRLVKIEGRTLVDAASLRALIGGAA
jgi:hypothetical protein